MDEVPIVTSNPVKPKIITSGPRAKEKLPGTFMNFFFVMPVALLILGLGFIFGMQIGSYTTFPLHSWQSLINLAAVLVLMLLVQMFLRSIIYSTLFSLVLVVGIFSSWFGTDFYTSISTNFRETLDILKTAWSNKDLPYSILMSSVVTGVLVVFGLCNFILSLFMKYSFETIFGRDWGDGRTYAFVTTLVLLISLSIGLKIHTGNTLGDGLVLWENKNAYRPLEEFCSRIPSSAQFCRDRVYSFDTREIQALDASTGKLVRQKAVMSAIPSNTWASVELPVIGTRMGFVAFEHDLISELWSCPYPEKLPGLELPQSDDQTAASQPFPIPLFFRTDLAKGHILAMFDYGYWSLISQLDGKILWLKPIDAQSKANRLFLEEFFKSSWVLQADDLLIFSCHNGRIAALKTLSGDLAWEYSHPETKYAGKGHRALLSRNGGKILAAYPSGSLIVLDLAKGTKVNDTKLSGHPLTAAAAFDEEAALITIEGNYLRFVVDGGRQTMSEPIFDTLPPLMPLPANISAGFIGFKSTLTSVNSTLKKLVPALVFPKRCFAVNPVLDGNFIYTGTQDGWLICLHKDSISEKWRMKLPGELAEDALFVTDNGLLARTRSGSIYCLAKGDPHMKP